MKRLKKGLIIAAVIVLFFPARGICGEYEEEGEQNDISSEIDRQLEELDLSPLEPYAGEISVITGETAASIDRLIADLAEDPTGISASSILDKLSVLFKASLKSSAGSFVRLVSAALLTALAGAAADGDVKNTLASVLSFGAVAAITAEFADLSANAFDTVNKISDLSDKTAPVMSILMISSGSQASAGLFRPMLVFLSQTVFYAVSRVIMPMVLASAILSIADVFSENIRLGEIASFLSKTVKWTLGLTSVFYISVTALNGLTAAARDGVMIRTTKYAIDKLIPAAGGMVSGSLDSVLGCALLIRNGAGIAVVLILISIILRPLLTGLAGIIVFRAAAAVSGPVADRKAVKLLSAAADAAVNLFACVAVCGTLFMLTVFAMIASGGLTAGLW